MHGNYNEEMAWRRLQDIQREMENRRLIADGGPNLVWWPARFAQRLWLVAGLATRRPPRYSARSSRPVAN